MSNISPPAEPPFCCAGFKHHFDRAGTRGFGVFAVATLQSKSWFKIQYRCVDPGSGPISPNTNFPISLIEEVTLNFCPWCGRDLHQWYSRTWETLTRPDLQTR